jgi:hypothetical protein
VQEGRSEEVKQRHLIKADGGFDGQIVCLSLWAESSLVLRIAIVCKPVVFECRLQLPLGILRSTANHSRVLTSRNLVRSYWLRGRGMVSWQRTVTEIQI